MTQNNVLHTECKYMTICTSARKPYQVPLKIDDEFNSKKGELMTCSQT